MRQPRKLDGQTWVRTPVPDEIHTQLRVMAAQRRVSLERLIRELLTQCIEIPTK